MTVGVTTAISHYSFGGLRIAVKRGNILYYLHGDQLGSTSLATAGSAVEASRADYAYGTPQHAASGDLQTDRTFTGQKFDATGLLYDNARYDDPALGTFVSPDSMVPDPRMVIDYNRFLYARGNPLKFTDPSGQEAYCFLGGWNPDTKNDKIFFHDHCTRMLTAIEFTKEEHGEIKIVGNSPWIVEEVYEEILALKTGKNPSSRPIVLACYSWGCPSALEVARLLSGLRHDDAGQPAQKHAPVRVDLLVMIEAEDFGHFFPLIRVPKNVIDSYYYYARDAENLDLKISINLSFLGGGLKELILTIPATEGTWANGPNYIDGVHKDKTFAIPGHHYNLWESLPWGKTPAEDVPLPAFPY